MRERQKAFIERIRECEEVKEIREGEKEMIGNHWRKKKMKRQEYT